jgi:hypothetical protein
VGLRRARRRRPVRDLVERAVRNDRAAVMRLYRTLPTPSLLDLAQAFELDRADAAQEPGRRTHTVAFCTDRLQAIDRVLQARRVHRERSR